VDAVGSYQKDRLGPSASVPVNTLNENASVGVRFSWSLFSGLGTLAEYKESVKRKEKAQADLLAIRRDVVMQISEVYSGLFTGIEQLRALNQSVSASEQVTRGMEKGYQVGARTLTEVLDAREELLKAHRARNEVFYRHLVNQLKLRLLVGELAD
jgi:outer membrane protein TolC